MVGVIRDPVTGDAARVTDVNRLQVEAEASPRKFFISRDLEQVFSGISSDASTTATDEILYIQNTSRLTLLFISKIVVTSNIAIKYAVKKVTGIAVGTDIVPENLNLTSTTDSRTTFKGDGSVTGLNDLGLPLYISRNLAGDTSTVDFAETLILGQNDAIALEILTSSADVDIVVDFHEE